MKNVLLVTSWETPCGIAAHSESLIRAIPWRSAGFDLHPDAGSLDPQAVLMDRPWKIVHLNHHDALHSRWTPDHIRFLQSEGIKVVVTYHDTREVAPEKLVDLCNVADATIIHEPVQGLAWVAPDDLDYHTHITPGKAIYLRQGIPAPPRAIADFWVTPWGGQRHPDGRIWENSFKAFPTQPVLGTVGFNFPWKNFDRLAELTAAEGWAIVILSNNATAADEERWRAMNPHALIIRKYLPEQEVLGYLGACDATAFPYECSNTGTSGAIRLGIAALKPVIAFGHCRQFRDLVQLDPDYPGAGMICWAKDWDQLRRRLHVIGAGAPWAPTALAWADRWPAVAGRYLEIYQQVLA